MKVVKGNVKREEAENMTAFATKNKTEGTAVPTCAPRQRWLTEIKEEASKSAPLLKKEEMMFLFLAGYKRSKTGNEKRKIG